jgi:hypothetical protein
LLSRHDLQDGQRCAFVFGDVLFEVLDPLADPRCQDRVSVLYSRSELGGFFFVFGDGRVGVDTIAAVRLAVVSIRFTDGLQRFPHGARQP